MLIIFLIVYGIIVDIIELIIISKKINLVIFLFFLKYIKIFLNVFLKFLGFFFFFNLLIF